MDKKKSAGIRFIVWLAVAVFLTVMLIMGISGFSFLGKEISCGGFGMGYTYPNADKYEKGDFTLEEEISRLEVNWISGNVYLKVTDDDKVYAEETEVSDDDRKMRYLVENGKLTIQFQKSKRFMLSSSFSKDLTVYIPKKMAENMNLIDMETTSANMEIDSFFSKKIDFDTVSGSINIKNLETEVLDVESVSGDVEGTEVKADELKVEIVSGDTDMDGAFEKIDLEAVSGDLRVVSEIFPRNVDAETVSGKITLDIPEGDGFTAKFDSVSGDFNTDFSISSKDGKKIYGNGGAEYSFDTVSGDVNVNRRK